MKNRNMKVIVSNQLLTQLADSVYDIAIFWYVYEVSQSALLASIITALTFATQILVGPLLGTFADRFEPKRFMQIGFLVMLTVGIFMAISFHFFFDYFLIVVYFGLILHDVGMFIVAPAKNRLLPRIVAQKNLLKVNGFISSSGQVATLIGTSISGFAIALIGFVGVMLSHSLIYLIASLILMFLVEITSKVQPTNIGEVAVAASNEEITTNKKTSILQELVQGYKYLRMKTEVFKLIILAMVVNVSTMVLPLFVVLVQVQYNGGAVMFGLFSAAASIASIIVGLMITKLTAKLSVAQIFSYSFLIAGITLMLLTLTSIPIIGIILYFSFTFVIVALNIKFNTYLITMVDDEVRGRVFGIIGAISGFLIPICSLLGGWLADTLHVNIVFLLSGAWIFCTGVYVFFDKDIQQIKEPPASEEQTLSI
ncbi:MFS transporter [Oceanobacillus kimchii]|nr:MFS transporter [Oceanobacillus kimchii]